MTNDRIAAVATLLVGLTLVGSSLAARRLPPGRTFRYALIWAAIFGVGYVATLYRGEAADVVARAKLDLGLQPSLTGGIVRVKVREDGHFYVTALVNGTRAEFLVDSGATVTALTRATAAAAGVEDDGLPPIPITTANGVVRARTARIEQLQVGSITQRDARATISDQLAGPNLLGISFLSKLKSWRVEGDTLTLAP